MQSCWQHGVYPLGYPDIYHVNLPYPDPRWSTTPGETCTNKQENTYNKTLLSTHQQPPQQVCFYAFVENKTVQCVHSVLQIGLYFVFGGIEEFIEELRNLLRNWGIYGGIEEFMEECSITYPILFSIGSITSSSKCLFVCRRPNPWVWNQSYNLQFDVWSTITTLFSSVNSCIKSF